MDITWRFALVVKLLDKRMSMRFMKAILEKIWNPKGRM